MSELSRRTWLGLAGALAGRGAAAAVPDRFDLVIKGGEVIDPSQSLGPSATSASLRRGGRPRAGHTRRAREAVRSTPTASSCCGLVDLHAHTYPTARDRHPGGRDRPVFGVTQSSLQVTRSQLTSRRSGATSPPRRGRECSPSSTSPTTACPPSGGRAVQPRQRAGGSLRPGDRREPGLRHRGQGPDVREMRITSFSSMGPNR